MSDCEEITALKLAAIAAHQRAIVRWLNAARDDRAALWPAVEAAWREVARLGIRTETGDAARQIARGYGAIA